MSGGQLRIAGAVLVALGFLALVLGGFGYNKNENVAQIGDFKMRVSERKQVNIPPPIAGIVILAGAALLFKGGGKPAE